VVVVFGAGLLYIPVCIALPIHIIYLFPSVG
jgi:hypothetical protein